MNLTSPQPTTPPLRGKPANAPRAPFGFTWQPITSELFQLLTLAKSPLAEALPLCEKYVPRLLAAKSERKTKILSEELQLALASKIQGTVEDAQIAAFILTTDPLRTKELIDKGREILVHAARWGFNFLSLGQWAQLQNAMTQYFATGLITYLIQRR